MSRSLPLLPLVLHRVPAALRQALAQEGIASVDFGPETAQGRLVLHDSSSGPSPHLLAGQSLIDVAEIRGAQPEDPFEALLDERAQTHSWRIGGLTVREEVACTDKRAVRRRILSRLRAMIEAQGGVWLRLSAFPFPYRSAFNFRIDHDDYEAEDLDRLFRAIAGREQATSHYVCGATHAAWPEAVQRLRGLDVGSHGYWHHVYLDQAENHQNVRRGIEFLRQAGIEPSGFVAPHGRFNRGLLTALESLGVTHSSEFGLAYDELPFFPCGGSVLQIPVHPVCLGLFIDLLKTRVEPRAAEVVRTATDHLLQVAEAKYRAGEPVFLYCHPTRRLGRYPQVVSEVLDCIAGFGAIWQTTLTQFASWWRARARIRLQLHRAGAEYRLSAEDLSPDWPVGVELWRGEHVALMPLASEGCRFSPDALAWQTRPLADLPQPVRVDAPHSLKRRMLRYVDWERVTPTDEIATNTFRGWAKRTLRRLRR
jgi:hypothetical protein